MEITFSDIIPPIARKRRHTQTGQHQQPHDPARQTLHIRKSNQRSQKTAEPATPAFSLAKCGKHDIELEFSLNAATSGYVYKTPLDDGAEAVP